MEPPWPLELAGQFGGVEPRVREPTGRVPRLAPHPRLEPVGLRGALPPVMTAPVLAGRRHPTARSSLGVPSPAASNGYHRGAARLATFAHGIIRRAAERASQGPYRRAWLEQTAR